MSDYIGGNRFEVDLPDDDSEFGFTAVDLRTVDAQTLQWVRFEAQQIGDRDTMNLCDEVTLIHLAK